MNDVNVLPANMLAVCVHSDQLHAQVVWVDGLHRGAN